MAQPETGPGPSRLPWLRIAGRVLLLVVGAVSLYFLAPQLVDVLAAVPRLEAIAVQWFAVMLLFESASFAAAWGLARAAVPELSWFVAGTAQLSANAVSRVVPGGAPAGGALYYRMLAVSGVAPGRAAAALTATTLLSVMALLALPSVAAVVAAASAPVPNGLIPVAVGGSVLFVVLFAFSVVAARFDRPLLLFGELIERLSGWVAARRKRPSGVTAAGFLARRDEIVTALGSRWGLALFAASANWLLDYLTLVGALYAVGARPRLSLVLLAYAASAVLGMIPITPGGLGFVEAGLTATLTVAGIGAGDALVATLAYRLYSFWLPIPSGAVAYVAYRRRYGKPPAASAEGEADVVGTV